MDIVLKEYTKSHIFKLFYEYSQPDMYRLCCFSELFFLLFGSRQMLETETSSDWYIRGIVGIWVWTRSSDGTLTCAEVYLS